MKQLIALAKCEMKIKVLESIESRIKSQRTRWKISQAIGHAYQSRRSVIAELKEN